MGILLDGDGLLAQANGRLMGLAGSGRTSFLNDMTGIQFGRGQSMQNGDLRDVDTYLLEQAIVNLCPPEWHMTATPRHHDGGIDGVGYQIVSGYEDFGPRAVRITAAISTETEWKAKALEDFEKLDPGEFDRFLVVTTQPISSGRTSASFKRTLEEQYPIAASKEIVVKGGDWVISLLSKEPEARVWRYRLGLPMGELPSVLSGDEFTAKLARRDGGAAPRFLGRDNELRILAELIGRGRDVLLVGPTGSGKSRLVAEAMTSPQSAAFIDSAIDRLTQPDFDRLRVAPVIIVDNVHVNEVSLRNITQARSDPRFGITAPIVAVSWPGHTAVSTSLNNPVSVDLHGMSGKEIVDLIRGICDCGDDAVGYIEHLAEGNPGLAVLGARAAARADIKSFGSIEEAMADRLRHSVTNIAATLIAAMVALDEEVDPGEATTIHRLVALTGDSRQSVYDALKDLEAKGILTPTRSGGLEIWPELLRRVVVAELVFPKTRAQRVSLSLVQQHSKVRVADLASLLGNLPLVADEKSVEKAIVDLVIGTDPGESAAIQIARGIAPRAPDVAYNLASQWIARSGEASLDSGELADLITFLLRYEPELGTMLALTAAINDKRIEPRLNSLTEHPMRRAHDEVQRLDSFSPQRKAAVAATALHWYRSDPTAERARIALMLLEATGDPQIHRWSSVPGDENTVAIQAGFLLPELTGVAMPPVIDAVGGILREAASPGAARHALNLLDSLDHTIAGGPGIASSTPDPRLSSILTPFRERLAAVLREVFPNHLGVRARLDEADAIELAQFGPIATVVSERRFDWHDGLSQIKRASAELSSWDFAGLAERLSQANLQLLEVSARCWFFEQLVAEIGSVHPEAAQIIALIEKSPKSQALAPMLRHGIAERGDMVWQELQRLLQRDAALEAASLLTSVPKHLLIAQSEENLSRWFQLVAEEDPLPEPVLMAAVARWPCQVLAVFTRALLSSRSDENFVAGFALITEPSDIGAEVISRLENVPARLFEQIPDFAVRRSESFSMLARHHPVCYVRLFGRMAAVGPGVYRRRREVLKRIGVGLRILDTGRRREAIGLLVRNEDSAQGTTDTLLRLGLEEDLAEGLSTISPPEPTLLRAFRGVAREAGELDAVQRVLLLMLARDVPLSAKTVARLLAPPKWFFRTAKEARISQVSARATSLEESAAGLGERSAKIARAAADVLRREVDEVGAEKEG